jgi:glycosyltransferase involved in cell wall biosynthesis
MIKALKKFFSDLDATISGWRFDDLKSSLNAKKRSLNSLTFHNSITRGYARLAPTRPAIAFISCLPPEDTGISTCSFYSWRGSQEAADLFCPVADTDMFFAMQTVLNSSQVALYDVDALLTLHTLTDYDHIVFAIGNSDHHLYLFDALKKLSFLGVLDRVVLYIHDPCLLNLIQKGTESTAHQLISLMNALYPDRSADKIGDVDDNWEAHSGLVSKGILGLRYFFSLGVDKFLVNSEAARTLLSADLKDLPVSVKILFHPVFLPVGCEGLDLNEIKRDDGVITIGTFGIPGPPKLTEVIIEAVAVLNRKNRPAKLVMAGFSAKSYAEWKADELAAIPHTVFDGPTDYQLARSMNDVDVAIQLRKLNLGESSGVVPQLLALGKTVIVSPVGAFLEYGDAVMYTDEIVTGESLAAVIENTLREGKGTRIARETYRVEHNPEAFRKALISALDGF